VLIARDKDEAARERRLARRRAYRTEHREEVLQKGREYYRDNRERILDQAREYREAHRLLIAEKQSHRRRRTKYRLTPADHTALLEAQGSRCACCGAELTLKSPIDHDHETGRVRGILCHNCNLGIGRLGDSIEGLERALAYLRKAARA
jgi:hypothetical protein